MSSEIKMSVSSLIRKDGNKAIYVLFSDRDKSAEFTIPEPKLLSNKGFSDQELANLFEYVTNQQDQIHKMAKEINPIKAFMK